MLAHELHQQEHEERLGGEELRSSSGDERVDQAELVEQDVLRDDHHVERQQQRADHRGEQDAEARELDPGERVRGQGEESTVPTTEPTAMMQRVGEELPHRHAGDALDDLDVVVERGVVRDQARCSPPNSAFGLERSTGTARPAGRARSR